jgi:nitroimidazol reductase NimA-like FMN-containing flavoprotein (pyridoxamine 5'-phosphate oxidase superfamily)
MENLDHDKYLNKPRTEIRRKKNEMTSEEHIKTLLKTSPSGHMATVHDGQPFLIPFIYVYVEEDHAVYFHGAHLGRTRANIELNPNACFNVTRLGRVLPAQTITEFNIEYQSVTIFGKASRIDDTTERERILVLLSEKFAPHLEYGVDYPNLPEKDILSTAIFKISIEEWSGKHNLKEGEFPDAYNFPFTPEEENKK